MSEIIVRKAVLDDVKRVQDLNYEVFVSDQKHFDDLNMDWPYQPAGEAYFRDLITGERGVCLVAEIDGRIVGYVGGGMQKPHAAYTGVRAELENIGVTPDYRSHGVGAHLVEAFYDWCRQRGAEHVMVNAYTPNLRAIEFYKKQGFEDYSTTLWRHL